MRREELEQITNKGDMCINHYRVMLHKSVTEDDLKHYNCNGFNYNCQDYHAAKDYYVNLNRGRMALIFR